MKAVSVLAILAITILVSPAVAATVTFASGDGSAVSSTGNVYNITPHPVWGGIPGAQWVSAYPNTGYGEGNVLPNWTSGPPTMTFTQEFLLPGPVNSGSATFGADDTMGVWLNGNLLKAPNMTQDSACADGPIACEPGELLTIILTPHLQQGNNVLEMQVYQLWGDVSGAIWAGSAHSVPEPTTFALMGLGLLGFGVIRRHKRASRRS